jgi:hypothetical protein
MNKEREFNSKSYEWHKVGYNWIYFNASIVALKTSNVLLLLRTSEACKERIIQ